MNRHAATLEPAVSWEWAICGASVIGSEHQRRGLGCDDAYSYGVAGDFVVAAVADGAGSVTGTSAVGSYTACQSIIADALKPRFIADHREATPAQREAMMRWLFERAVECVRRQADYLELDVGLLATTLCVAVADPTSATFGQIGDGIIATENGDDIQTVLSETKDEYANATWFIQSEGSFATAYRCVTRADSTAFALSSDGMSYKITNVATGEAYQPFFRGSWEHVRGGVSSANLAALLSSIEDDQTGDDKTMVLAALRQRDLSSSADPQPRTFTDSSPPPPPMLETSRPAPHHEPPPAENRPAPSEWVTVTRTLAEPDVSETPVPPTDDAPFTGRGPRRLRVGRRRQT